MFKKLKRKLLENKVKAKGKGTHYFTFHDATHPVVQAVSEEIEDLRKQREKMIKYGMATSEFLANNNRRFRQLMKSLDPYVTKRVVMHNLVTTDGFNVITRLLSGDLTYSGVINYTALGSDNTAPALGDSTLGTEVYRKAVSSSSFSGATANIETFYTATETSGTYEEYGNFIDGTGSADTGQLFNRFTQSVTKSNTETLNVRSEITFSNA